MNFESQAAKDKAIERISKRLDQADNDLYRSIQNDDPADWIAFLRKHTERLDSMLHEFRDRPIAEAGN